VGPLLYIAGYVLAVVFFVPGLPITLLGGLAFGPVWGTVYVSIAATSSGGGRPSVSPATVAPPRDVISHTQTLPPRNPQEPPGTPWSPTPQQVL